MLSSIGQLFGRFERLFRYGLVGGVTTLIYSTLTLAFIALDVIHDPTVASVIAATVTQPAAFFLHRKFSYPDASAEPNQGLRFGVIAVSSIMMGAVCVKVVDIMHAPIWIGLAIGWFVIPIANYLITALWVFRTRMFKLERDKMRR